MEGKKDIVVVGGGLAGLTLSILLAKAGIQIQLIEKKRYPFHRVCGEYISNEVVDFLNREDIYPHELDPSNIRDFQLTSTNGTSHSIRLPLGGFGISRHAFDFYLFQKAEELGVEILQGTTVNDITKDGSAFDLSLSDGNQITSQLVVGSFGKRSNLDNALKREFFSRKSPYLGVKYHIHTDHAIDLITLHNFENGYCGISKVEGDTYNLCYLSHRDNLKKTGSIESMEKEVLFQNPFLKSLFINSDFLFEKPITINEISFRRKPLIDNGVIMCGDTAGMITPLCGNGMAIAIRSAKILSEFIIQHKKGHAINRKKIEAQYQKAWDSNFSKRLMVGRTVQKMFGGTVTSALAVQILKTGIGRFLVGQTHGKPF